MWVTSLPCKCSSLPFLHRKCRNCNPVTNLCVQCAGAINRCSDHKCKDNLPVELVVDTSSAVSIITKCLRRDFSDVPLTELQRRLVTYTTSDVSVRGCLPATAQHRSTAVAAALYAAKTGTALLGMDLFRALKLSIDITTVLSPAAPAAVIKEIEKIKAGSVTVEKLGFAKGFIHRGKVGEDVQPVQQMRRLPLAVKQAAAAELGRLGKRVFQDDVPGAERSQGGQKLWIMSLSTARTRRTITVTYRWCLQCKRKPASSSTMKSAAFRRPTKVPWAHQLSLGFADRQGSRQSHYRSSSAQDAPILCSQHGMQSLCKTAHLW